MDDAARDALRERNRRRARCLKCGGPLERFQADDEAHFAALVYVRCRGCGWESPVKPGKALAPGQCWGPMAESMGTPTSAVPYSCCGLYGPDGGGRRCV